MAHRFRRSVGTTRSGARYDGRHQRARRLAAQYHQPTDPCARCGHPLGPMGRWLHLDHDEQGGYLGFSHGSLPCPFCGVRCNIVAGAIKGDALARGRQVVATPTSPALEPRATRQW